MTKTEIQNELGNFIASILAFIIIILLLPILAIINIVRAIFGKSDHETPKQNT